MSTGNTRERNFAGSSVIEYTETDYLPYSDRKIFNIIADVERYPEFLPGWMAVNVKSRDEHFLTAHQKIGVPLFNWEFNSSAELDNPRHIHVFASDGPFRDLDIHWYIDSITRYSARVTLTVKVDFELSARSVVHSVLRRSVHSLLEHFSQRARDIYG